MIINSKYFDDGILNQDFRKKKWEQLESNIFGNSLTKLMFI